MRGPRVEMKTEFASVRGEMRERFDKVDERFDRMDAHFDKIDRRFERMDERFEKMDERLLQIYQTMLGFCGVALAALIGFIGTQI